MPLPRTQRGHHPSPLAKEVHMRPLSVQQEDMAEPDLVFWKRFSTAIREAEEAGAENSRGKLTSVGTSESIEKPRNDWLARQRQKKRRCRIIAWSVALSVCLVITAAVIVARFFTTGFGKADSEKS